MIATYLRDNLIIVKTLFSRSPLNKRSHGITLEKLIVDVLSDKYLSNILGTSGIEHLIQGIKKNYVVNESKMHTYAKRRNHEKELEFYWGQIERI